MASSSSSSTVLPRWSKKKEEEEEAKKNMKLKAETIELLNQFFKTVSVTKASVTADEGKAISSAYVKMSAIRRGLVNRNPPPAAADILECRSKIERQISGICSKLSNLKIKDSYLLHLRHLKASSTNPQIYRELKRKAAMQQPPKAAGTRKQNSVKAKQFQQDTSITEENYLEKLILEEKDYAETARFIETSLRMRTTKEDRQVLCRAYMNFIRAYMRQRRVISSIQQDGETKEIDLHMISNNRSIIVKELSDVCDKVSNLMIKEAYLHHLDEFKTGTKPKKHTQSFINQEESPEIFFEMKGGSGSRRSKSLNRITKKPFIYEDTDEDEEEEEEEEEEDDFYEDHNNCHEEELERKFPQFGRIGNWDPIYEGRGADLLHAPVNHPVKEGHWSYYNMMREESKSEDTYPKYRVAPYDFDVIGDFYERKYDLMS